MLKQDALSIINAGIKASLPYDSTAAFLKNAELPEKNITVFSIGKAAVPMAQAAADVLGSRIKTGLLITKYGHTNGKAVPGFEITEAGHPVSDDNSIKAAERALEIADGLDGSDTVLVLLSGGGSALFEKSSIDRDLQRDITKKLLARGAVIEEINALRGRLSLVKGGRFAARCFPARVITLALSDVLSNDKSVIAGGITVPDITPAEVIKRAEEKYLYDIPENVRSLLYKTEELTINDGGYYFAGDINSLCDGALKKAEELGYGAVCPKRNVAGEARDIAMELLDSAEYKNGKNAYIWGGETTVTLRGNGKGGRNQEMALAAAIVLRGSENIVFACVGSDGTDGPTDAAGGIVDGGTFRRIKDSGLDPEDELDNNNSYFALKAAGDLVVTGATGTNVNDIAVLLTEPRDERR